LRGLLDDTYFIQAVKKVVQEPIPYFRQFTEKHATIESKETPPISSTPRKTSDPTFQENNGFMEIKIFAPDISDENIDVNNEEMEVDNDFEKTSEISQTASLPMTPHSATDQRSSPVDEDQTSFIAEARKLKEKQTIKKRPEFGNCVEQILENTVLNLMYEALSSEYSVVSKPRFIAMPRKRPSMTSGANALANTSGVTNRP
ncbi:hypothetical protein EGW08_001064, partial [Elysia chlorotica]